MDTKKHITTLALRILVCLIGLIIIAVGVSLFTLSGLGCDPGMTFSIGVARQLHVADGTGLILVNIGITLTICLCKKWRYLNIGTVMSLFLVGLFVNLFTPILAPLMPEMTFVNQMLIMLCGTVVVAFGVAFYMAPRIGVGPIDLVSVILCDQLHKRFFFIRICVDAAFTLFGFLLGGTVSWGTLTSALLTGPIVDLFMPLAYWITYKISGFQGRQVVPVKQKQPVS